MQDQMAFQQVLMNKAQHGNADRMADPLQNGILPVHMLMEQHICTILPEDLLTPKGAHKIKLAKIKVKQKQKQQHDRWTKHLEHLKPGEIIRIRVTGI